MHGCWLNKGLLKMVENQGSNWIICFWMFTDNKTTVRDGGLSKKPDERCDIVLCYVKQSIDTDGSIHIIAKKVFPRMIIDGTTNKSWWIFTQKNAMEDRTLFDYPCRKRPSCPCRKLNRATCQFFSQCVRNSIMTTHNFHSSCGENSL